MGIFVSSLQLFLLQKEDRLKCEKRSLNCMNLSRTVSQIDKAMKIKLQRFAGIKKAALMH